MAIRDDIEFTPSQMGVIADELERQLAEGVTVEYPDGHGQQECRVGVDRDWLTRAIHAMKWAARGDAGERR